MTRHRLENVPSPDELNSAIRRRLRAEIIAQYETVKAFAPQMTTIRYEGLNDNLNGRSEMRLNVLIEALTLLGFELTEFMQLVNRDLEAS